MDRAVARDQPGGRRTARRGDPPAAGDRGEAGGGTGGTTTGTSAAPGTDELSLRIPARVEQLRPLRRRVEQWAHRQGLDEDVLIDLQLAVGEAVSNAMEHAYRDDEPGTVDVDLRIRPGGRGGRELVGRVRDRGRWKPASSRPSYRGRGIAMIEGLSAGMRVTSNHGGTEVVFTVDPDPDPDVDLDTADRPGNAAD